MVIYWSFVFQWKSKILPENPVPACMTAIYELTIKPQVNGRNIVRCYMLHPFAHPVACC